MITKEEAEKRIRLWNGDYYQKSIKRQDGFEFIEIKLFYYDEKQRLEMWEIKTPKIMENPYRAVVVDTFIHPK